MPTRRQDVVHAQRDRPARAVARVELEPVGTVGVVASGRWKGRRAAGRARARHEREAAPLPPGAPRSGATASAYATNDLESRARHSAE